MTRLEINPSKGLLALIAANAPYWGAEAEVIRTYWDSPVRGKRTDRKWLTHQIYKEYWDGVQPYLVMFNQHLSAASSSQQRAKLQELAEIVSEEVGHFVLFADLYQALDGADYPLSPQQLKAAGAWPENDALMAVRKKHHSQSPDIGQRATRFTEGGYVALFSEGMKLAGRGAFDTAVAEVCKKIYDEEFNHMLLGIIETDNQQLSNQDWELLVNYTVEQMQRRIVMRNAQFSHPVSEHRMQALLAGEAVAVNFDFDHAAQLMSNG